MKITQGGIPGFFLMCVCWSLGSLAAPLHDALKDIKPAGTNCPKSDLAVVPATKSVMAPIVAPDMLCAVGVDEVSGSLSRGDGLLVDTRTAGDYEAFRVDGALNLAVNEIKTKSFLRSRPLILAGGGKGDRELYETCRELKSRGFSSVKVLRGGMLAWVSAQKPVVGQAPDPASLARLSPEELSKELLFNNNLVLTTLPRAQLKGDLKRSVNVGTGDPKSIKAAVAVRKKPTKNQPSIATIVVVLGEKADRARLVETMQEIQPDPTLFYTEPVQGYTDYLASQKAMWNAQERGPKVPRCNL